MREWLLARLRRGSSSRRAMLANGNEAHQPAADEEKGGAGPAELAPTNGASKGTAVEESKEEAAQRSTPSTSDADADEEMPPTPARLPRSASNHHSFAESVRSVFTSIHHHKLPKWQYRLLVSSVVVLLLGLALLLLVSLLYGFGLQFPQISVLATEPLEPNGLVDAHGNVPLRSYLGFQNPNVFRIYCQPSVVTIFTDPECTHVLGRAQVPALALHSHENNRTVVSEYAIEGIMQVPGGRELVKRVLQGKPTFFYTASVIRLRVKGLGFVPVTRHYEVKCRILKLWPRPGGNGTAATTTPAQDGDGDEPVSVADCHGRFV